MQFVQTRGVESLDQKAARYKNLVGRLEKIHRERGGLTWNLQRGDVLRLKYIKTAIYVGIVSLAGGIVLKHPPTAIDFLSFIQVHETRLTTPPETWLSIGSWRNGSIHYIDLSIVCFDRYETHRLGRENKQESVYIPFRSNSERVLFEDAVATSLAQDRRLRSFIDIIYKEDESK